MAELSASLKVPLEVLITACWIHLLRCYSSTEQISAAIILDQPQKPNQALFTVHLPVETQNSVEEWLKQTAAKLQASGAEKPTMAATIAGVDTVLIFGSRVEEAPFSGLGGKLIVHVQTDQGIRISIDGSDSRFGRELREILLDCLLHLLQQLPSRRSESVLSLELVSSAMQAKYLRMGTPLNSAPENRCVHQLIAEQAQRTPDRVAAVDGGRQITYRELDEQSNQLARYLAKFGSGSETLVAAYLNRSVDLLIALLAILKSGAAFLPLDVSLPEGRVNAVVKDSGAILVVSSSQWAGRLPLLPARIVCIDTEKKIWAKENRAGLFLPYAPQHLAYVTYTSGSTGKPKGVMIEHRNLTASLAGMDQILGTEAGVWLAMANISFDISITEMLWTLVNGFQVVMHEGDNGAPILAGPHSVTEQMVAHGVTHLQGTPSLMRVLSGETNASAAFAKIRKLLVGGEHFPPGLATVLRQLVPGDVLNMYGPTEVTICSVFHRVLPTDETIPIGKPTLGTSVYVLDKHNRLLPPFAPGELFLGGASVGRGYLGRPDLTAERFIKNPVGSENERLYRTGDLVRLRLDGELEFIDRVDSQVKLRGYRIELGEIESALETHPGVEQAAVVVHLSSAGEKVLAAFYVPRVGNTVSGSDLRMHLEQILPRYMMPSFFQSLHVLPLTATGKLDRTALVKFPTAARNPVTTEARNDHPPLKDAASVSAQVSEIETTLCAWCSELLAASKVQPGDDFFELGGQSLTAVQMAQRIAKKYQVHMMLSVLVHHRTMRAIAEWIVQVGRDNRQSWSPVVNLRNTGSKAPIFLLAGIGGNVINFDALCKHLGDHRPIYAIETKGIDREQNVLPTIEEMAASYLREIQRIQPSGPYYLAGYSFGGLIAYEMSQQLWSAGQEVAFLGLIDTPELQYMEEVKAALPWVERIKISYGGTVRRLVFGPDRSKAFAARVKAAQGAFTILLRQMRGQRPQTEAGQAEQRNLTALSRYVPKIYDYPLHLFRCPDTSKLRGTDPLLGWGRVANQIIVTEVPGQHGILTLEPFVGFLGAALLAKLESVASHQPDTQRRGRLTALKLVEHASL